MLRNTLMSSALAVALLGAGPALAADSTTFEGSYLLVQDNAHKRVLSFAPGGNVSQVSDQEASIGFTAGLGTWTPTGPDTVRAVVINFNHDIKETDGGDGATRVVYDLTFSDLQDGKYRSLAGSYAGESFDEGQNPVAATQQPVHTFAADFIGQRIGAGSGQPA
ncbi:hypothetical protein [Hoeflea sp. TYP-13]|uniref:hypothetical protein n=1 Tax=Hoeflea sp. TYP-13 TaxID=3230023 RepID=UPI0034C5B797